MGNKSRGHMYPWVDLQFTPLGGECPHRCTYCYVDHIPFGRPEKYRGEIRLIELEFRKRFAFEGPKTIFVGHMHDLWARGVPDGALLLTLKHCQKWPHNTYVFQTKNPARYNGIFQPGPYEERIWLDELPPKVVLGCTIETNRADLAAQVSLAPDPAARFSEMKALRARAPHLLTFITVEPILDFDVDVLAGWLTELNLDFVNLGADSKRHNLPEPSREKVLALLEVLKARRVLVLEKQNLDRLIFKEESHDGTHVPRNAREQSAGL